MDDEDEIEILEVFTPDWAIISIARWGWEDEPDETP
jgi:hypothetical protein